MEKFKANEPPIIYVHRNKSYYLYATLWQAHASNPSRSIILLGDETNDIFSFVTHYNIKDYFEKAEDFAKVYKHYSPNSIDFELFCFQRWFIIEEFLRKELSIEQPFFYCDTDTLLFFDITNDISTWNKYDFTICRTGTPCFTFFSKGIKKFTDYIYNKYTTEYGLEQIKNYAEKLKFHNRKYGISDMTAFISYENEKVGNVLHVDVPINGLCFCHNFQDVNDGFVMSGNFIDIRFVNGMPCSRYLFTNEDVIFKGIHFQGISKKQMIKFLDRSIRYKVLLMYYVEKVLSRFSKIKRRMTI